MAFYLRSSLYAELIRGFLNFPFWISSSFTWTGRLYSLISIVSYWSAVSSTLGWSLPSWPPPLLWSIGMSTFFRWKIHSVYFLSSTFPEISWFQTSSPRGEIGRQSKATGRSSPFVKMWWSGGFSRLQCWKISGVWDTKCLFKEFVPIDRILFYDADDVKFDWRVMVVGDISDYSLLRRFLKPPLLWRAALLL